MGLLLPAWTEDFGAGVQDSTKGWHVDLLECRKRFYPFLADDVFRCSWGEAIGGIFSSETDARRGILNACSAATFFFRSVRF
ncbi:hypothetical protein DMENIID0001_170890 [Sergentomyia squamirostris]